MNLKKLFGKNHEILTPKDKYFRNILVLCPALAVCVLLLAFLPDSLKPAAVPLTGIVCAMLLWALIGRLILCRSPRLTDPGFAMPICVSMAIPSWLMFSIVMMRTLAPYFVENQNAAGETLVMVAIIMSLGTVTVETILVPLAVGMAVQYLKETKKEEKSVRRFVPLAVSVLHGVLVVGGIYLLYRNR